MAEDLTYQLNWANELDQRRLVKKITADAEANRLIGRFKLILLSLMGGYNGVREATAKYSQFTSRWKTVVPVIIRQTTDGAPMLQVTYGDMVTWTIKLHENNDDMAHAMTCPTVLDAEAWAIKYRDGVLIGDCSLMDLACHSFLTTLVGFFVGLLTELGKTLVVRTDNRRHYLFAGDELLFEVSGAKEPGHPKYSKES